MSRAVSKDRSSKTTKHQKSMKIHLEKWLSSNPLRRSLSLSAKGLWLHLYWLMHTSPVVGYLELANEKPMSITQIARAVGAPIGQVNALITELLNVGALCKDSRGVLYSPELVEQDVRRAIRRERARKRRASIE